uniref:Peptidase M23 n=1 Tax=Cyanothece sp. (strain PCC 7425 / ATCC 29141) TaxID=395961 RepID=B8HSE9_CYAP4
MKRAISQQVDLLSFNRLKIAASGHTAQANVGRHVQLCYARNLLGLTLLATTAIVTTPAVHASVTPPQPQLLGVSQLSLPLTPPLSQESAISPVNASKYQGLTLALRPTPAPVFFEPSQPTPSGDFSLLAAGAPSTGMSSFTQAESSPIQPSTSLLATDLSPLQPVRIEHPFTAADNSTVLSLLTLATVLTLDKVPPAGAPQSSPETGSLKATAEVSPADLTVPPPSPWLAGRLNELHFQQTLPDVPETELNSTPAAEMSSLRLGSVRQNANAALATTAALGVSPREQLMPNQLMPSNPALPVHFKAAKSNGVQETPSRPQADSQPLPQSSLTLSPQSPVSLGVLDSPTANPAAIVKRSIFPQLPNLDLPPLLSPDRYLPGDRPALTAQFIWPAQGVFTSGFGPRWGRMHRGIDIAAPIGTPIVAAASGVVVTSGWNSGGFGNLIEIRHPDGSLTLYAHNNRLLARVGQQVEQGQQIAEMGTTGRSTGPHVHFEIHPAGMGAVNPMLFLNRG